MRANIVEILRSRAERQGDKQAYVFLRKNEGEAMCATFAEVDNYARTVAGYLQKIGKNGDRVLLFFPQEFPYIPAFLGVLYAGLIPVPLYPPRPNQKLSRVAEVAQSCDARIALTTQKLFTRLTAFLGSGQAYRQLHLVAVDELAQAYASDWQMPKIHGTNLAFLQYTSGSTGTPKGVMVTHENLMDNEEKIMRAFKTKSGDIGVNWLPFYHDMGLIGTVLQTLYTGIVSVMMSADFFIRDPFRWLREITRYRATICGGPNFAYELILKKSTPELLEGLDLSTWRIAFNGAEPVRARTLERFSQSLAPVGFRPNAFYPCYGMAEATLFVSGADLEKPPLIRSIDKSSLEQNQIKTVDKEQAGALKIVSCGGSEDQIIIVDPDSRSQCQENRVGEIWISGLSVARGYWGLRQESERTFGARLSDTGKGPFLRTGDLGFILDGALFVTGRLKDLIIIRGRNHYPTDIELTVAQCFPGFQPGGTAAFSVEIDGEEHLAVVQEIQRSSIRTLDAPRAIQAIRTAISQEHELLVSAIVLCKPGGIARTSSGKIRRNVCRRAFLENRLPSIGLSKWESEKQSEPFPELDLQTLLEERHPHLLLEDFLRKWLAGELQLGLDQIDRHQSPAELGLDSLRSIKLQHQLEQDLRIRMPLDRILSGATLARLSSEIIKQLQPVSRETVPNETTPKAKGVSGFSPMSANQKALWFQYQLNPENPAFNIFYAAKITGKLNASAMRAGFQFLLDRHPSLRTCYASSSWKEVQQVCEQPSLFFREIDASNWSEQQLNHYLDIEAHRPFQLEKPQVLRLYLLRLGNDRFVFLINIHHIAADFWSLLILLEEWRLIYQYLNGHDSPPGQAREARRYETPASRQRIHSLLPTPTTSYLDYTMEQSKILAGPQGERLWSYWRELLSGELPVLSLPTDLPRPPTLTYQGSCCSFKLKRKLARKLQDLSRASGVTLYATLLAAFQTLLHRYSNQDDIVLGSSTAGRHSVRYDNVIGYFVNLYVSRAKFFKKLTFERLLQRTAQRTLEALTHQEFPFQLLVERLQQQRDESRFPLFQVMFIMQKAHLLNLSSDFLLKENGARLKLGDLEFESVTPKPRATQFDLTLIMAEGGMTGPRSESRIQGCFEFNVNLFAPETVRRMARHFEILLEGIANHPEGPLSELPMLSDSEREQILVEWNKEGRDALPALCVHQLFEIQQQRTPDAVAFSLAQEPDGVRRRVSDATVTGKRTVECGAITYSALNRYADRVAYHLIRKGIGPESFVGIYLDRSIEMTAALLGVFKAGGTYVPLDPSYPRDRLAFMTADANISTIITRGALMDDNAPKADHLIDLKQAFQEIKIHGAGSYAYSPRAGHPLAIAYVIYTSGSTGVPKGVLGAHQGMVNRFQWMWKQFPFEPDERGCQKTSLNFLDSFWEIFGPLCRGISTVIIPNDQAKDPFQLVAALRDWRVTRLVLVPSLLGALLDAFPDLDQILIRIKLWTTSGEALSPSLFQRFRTRMPKEVRLLNLYGSSEASADSLCHDTSTSKDLHHVPIGRPISNTRVYILDHQIRPVPLGIEGELYLEGPGLFRGYLNRPALTAEKLTPCPFGEIPGTRLFKTGDLVRYLHDGSVAYSGRLDQQIKIRGYRIELREIESILIRHTLVGQALVTCREDKGEKFLVAYVRLKSKPAPNETDGVLNQLHHFVKQQLPEFMAPSFFVVMDRFPMTPSGKVDRRNLPLPTRNVAESSDSAPRNDLERSIALIFEEILQRDRIGIYQNFFELGGHSLLATRAVARLREKFSCEIGLRRFFLAPTIAALAQNLREAGAARQDIETPVIPTLPRTGVGNEPQIFPTSYSQDRLWFLHQLEESGTSYNMAFGIRLLGKPLYRGFSRSISEMIRRHEILRTVFIAEDGKPFQKVLPELTLSIPTIDLKGLTTDIRLAELQSLMAREALFSFDLSRGPLFKMMLFHLSECEHVLMLVMDHIISDGWSAGLFFGEFASLYQAFLQNAPSPLPALPIQYADYAVWQRRTLSRDSFEDQLAYWKKQLLNAPFTLAQPTDFPRASLRTSRGSSLPLKLSVSLSESLRVLSNRHGATLFMTLLAALEVLVYKDTGAQDLVIGTDVANREHTETESLIGFFVNQIVVRNHINGNLNFAELLRRVRHVMMDAYANQSLPFDILVDALTLHRDLSRTPLFQIKFVLQNAPLPKLELPGLTLSLMDLEQKTAKFDILFNLRDTRNGIEGRVEYNTQLYRATTVSRIIENYQSLVQLLARDQDASLDEMIWELERQRKASEIVEDRRHEEESGLRLKRTKRRRREVSVITNSINK